MSSEIFYLTMFLIISEVLIQSNIGLFTIDKIDSISTMLVNGCSKKHYLNSLILL